MALNPFFLQGSSGEQRLVQSLVNEQLRMYGVEVIYIPRKFVNKKTIIQEIQSSRFDDNFAIEAYLNNYDGYSGSGDILTKFGVSIRDEVNLTISKERFEDFIGIFLNGMSASEIELSTRPREGDLVYFPLGQRLFEVKFVEHEQPFYQLGKLYVYELKCELFEYEDEILDTNIDEVDKELEDIGFITTLTMVGAGQTATASAIIRSGYIRKLFLNNDGYEYLRAPQVAIGTAPTGLGNTDARAIAITTTRGGVSSVQKILFSNAGIGYTIVPSINFISQVVGSGSTAIVYGAGAAATCSVETQSFGVISINISDGGVGYSTNPIVTISGPSGIGSTAIAESRINSSGVVTSILISDPGFGYDINNPPTITISAPETITGVGTYTFNEIIVGQRSGLRARVKSWDSDDGTLKVSFVGASSTQPYFYPGETITGQESGAIFSVRTYNQDDIYDKYSQNDEIEEEADLILDFSESNPFGTY
jgi:hypothetical protein